MPDIFPKYKNLAHFFKKILIFSPSKTSFVVCATLQNLSVASMGFNFLKLWNLENSARIRPS